MLLTLAGSGSVCDATLIGCVTSGMDACPVSPGSCARGTRIGRPLALVPAVTGVRWAGTDGTDEAGASPAAAFDHQRVPLAGGAALPRAAAPMMSSAREGPRRGAGPAFDGRWAGGPEAGDAAVPPGTPETG